MKNKKKQIKAPLRILIFLVSGFALAMICMTIAIYFGYDNAYKSSMDNYSVYLFGLEIYTLTKTGTEYAGTSIGMNMGILCMAFMAVTVGIEEITRKLICNNRH